MYIHLNSIIHIYMYIYKYVYIYMELYIYMQGFAYSAYGYVSITETFLFFPASAAVLPMQIQLCSEIVRLIM